MPYIEWPSDEVSRREGEELLSSAKYKWLRTRLNQIYIQLTSTVKITNNETKVYLLLVTEENETKQYVFL